MLGAVTYLYVSYGRIIDARLHGERDRAVPRVFARPLTLQTGQSMSQAELVARLNDVGYAQRARVERAGEFAIDRQHRGAAVARRRSGGQGRDGVVPGTAGRSRRRPRSRRHRRRSASSKIQVAGEDHRPRDARRAAADRDDDRLAREAPPRRARGDSGAHAGGGARDRGPAFLLPPRRRSDPHGRRGLHQRLRRSAVPGRRQHHHAAAGAQLLPDRADGRSSSRRASARTAARSSSSSWRSSSRPRRPRTRSSSCTSNDVYLGNRGSFALHGVAEASKIYFGKDVSNLTLSEAALIAGVIQSPFNHSPFNNPERARDRRNVVLRAMVDAGYITGDAADRAQQEPIAVVARAVDNEAPYFVDYIGDVLDTHVSRASVSKPGALDIYTTLDLNLQRYAQDAVRDGIASVDTILARRKRGPARVAQAALVAIDPRTGEILAFIGGRSYNQSQFNRAAAARRQIGSTFKPFVYLAAFEKAADEGTGDITPATIVYDEPTTWSYDNQEWSPKNYDGEYDGAITLRRALAMSRNIAAVKVAEQTGYDRVVALWKQDQGRRARSGEALSVGRARRRRADAARSGRGLHGVPEPRHAEEAARD